MRVALRGSYVEYVIFMGITEKYPPWFEEIIYDQTIGDESGSGYTFYVYQNERTMDYYEKTLIEDYSVILRKPNGEVHVTNYDIFSEIYVAFTYDSFYNSGIAALEEDSIEYVECQPGVLSQGYPNWFYEYFTEAFNYPPDNETIFMFDTDRCALRASRDSIEITAGGEALVTEHCVFLHNKYGEIRGMRYHEFLKYYDPEPRREMDYGR